MKTPTKPVIDLIVVIITTIILSWSLLGCETAHGFGKDTEKAGQKIQEKTQ